MSNRPPPVPPAGRSKTRKAQRRSDVRRAMTRGTGTLLSGTRRSEASRATSIRTRQTKAISRIADRCRVNQSAFDHTPGRPWSFARERQSAARDQETRSRQHAGPQQNLGRWRRARPSPQPQSARQSGTLISALARRRRADRSGADDHQHPPDTEQKRQDKPG